MFELYEDLFEFIGLVMVDDIIINFVEVYCFFIGIECFFEYLVCNSVMSE